MIQKRKHRKFRSLYIWHRYAGIVAAFFTLILAVTGIALNHTERLKLDSSYIESEHLLDWYGIKAPVIERAYQLDKHWLLHIGERLYLNKQRIAGNYTKPAGALSFAHYIAVAVSDQILLITHDGEIIERLGGVQGVPSGMQRIGILKDGHTVIQTAHGYFQTDRDFLKWQEKIQVEGVAWSVQTDVPEALKVQTGRLYRSNELPLERVMLDLHSGRLFGSEGPLVMDVAAVLLIFLAMSGVWLWGKQIYRRRQHRLKGHRHVHE